MQSTFTHKFIMMIAAGFAAACCVMFVVSFSLTALGFCIAWRMSSTQGFHAIMNLFLMPLWFLSGALFPARNAFWPIRMVMRANPLTYGVIGLQRFLFAHSYGPGQSAPEATASFPSVATCVTVTILFSAVAFALAVWLTTRRSVRNAR